MATFQDGNVRRATDNSVTAARLSAERRRCPRCKRKSAVARIPVESPWGMRGSYCRWEDCGWSHTYDVDVETREQAQARWAREDAAYEASA